jgi:hypothetical protein
LRIGFVDGGYSDRALARFASIHSAERHSMGLALMPAAFVFLPLFRIREQNRLKENERSGFPRRTRPQTA